MSFWEVWALTPLKISSNSVASTDSLPRSVDVFFLMLPPCLDVDGNEVFPNIVRFDRSMCSLFWCLFLKSFNLGHCPIVSFRKSISTSLRQKMFLTCTWKSHLGKELVARLESRLSEAWVWRVWTIEHKSQSTSSNTPPKGRTIQPIKKQKVKSQAALMPGSDAGNSSISSLMCAFEWPAWSPRHEPRPELRKIQRPYFTVSVFQEVRSPVVSGHDDFGQKL